jgi:hypothetical protein
VNRGFDTGLGPDESREHIEQTNATFAALGGLPAGFHPADVESPLLGEST